MLTGETREVRTTGGYVAPSVGDLALFGRAFPGTNIRDSDMAGSINIAVAGPGTGKPYPLYNWACQYAGLAIQVS